MAAIPFAVWLKKHAAAQPPVIRYSARSVQGQAMLAKYANAVKTMKDTAEGDPKNWIFQWYTHWVRRDRTKAAEIARVYADPSTPQRALAEEIWNTCQSHFLPPEFQKYFLPWHRMYVYFFERIVRRVSGDAEFSLPYWEYSTPEPANHRAIPSEFRMPSDATFKWLFVDNRNVGVNDGHPIDQGQFGNPLGLDSLLECTYEPQGVKPGFCRRIDRGLHGQVHVLVGDPENMGDVPWAARDPIFWLHHCNIDRLWASWNRAGRQNPTDSQWLSKPFVFADENGNRVSATVDDVVNTEKLGYTYDQFETVPTCPSLGPLIASAASIQTRATVPLGAVTLGANPVRVTLTPPSESGLTPVPLTARVRNLPTSRRLYLVLRNLRAEAQPGILYQLYIDLPAGTTAGRGTSYRVGTLNFFDAVGHNVHPSTAVNASLDFFSFDVTDVMKRLHSRSQLKATPTLSIVPVGKPNIDSKPVIGEITLVEQ